MIRLVCLSLSALSRYARLCVVDARPTSVARVWASAAGWGGHRKYMNKQIDTYLHVSQWAKPIINELFKDYFKNVFHESNPKEFLWAILSDLTCPIGADSSSINKEFFAISFFAKCLMVVRKI